MPSRWKRIALVGGTALLAAGALTGLAAAADGLQDAFVNPDKQAAIDAAQPVDPGSVSFGNAYQEPVPDLGDLTTVAQIRTVVPQLLTDATSAGRLPEAIPARVVEVQSPMRKQAREDLLKRVWAPSVVGARSEELQQSLESGMNDAGYHPFDDNRFTVTAWQGVRVSSEGVTVFLLGHASYRLGSEAWDDDPIEQWQLSLTSGGPLGYQLVNKAAVGLPNSDSGR